MSISEIELDKAFRAKLAEDPALKALIDGRLYAQILEKGAKYPALVISLEQNSEPTHGGGTQQTIRVVLAAYGVSENFAESRNITKQVYQILQGFHGNLNNEFRVLSCRQGDLEPNYEHKPDAFISVMTFSVLVQRIV